MTTSKSLLSKPLFVKQSKKPNSLFWRLITIFSLSVLVVWSALLAWIVFVALESGREGMKRELDTFSRQVLPVAVALRDQPDQIAAIFSNLELLEDELENDDPDDFFVDVEISGERVYSGAQGFVSPPLTVGYEEFEHDGDVFWSDTSIDSSNEILTRITFRGVVAANIELPDQLAVFFLPLIVSLPLLLIPAWFMARLGLRPLDNTAELISSRVEARSLEPLPNSNYRELNSVVSALNRLLRRSKEQLDRERNLVAEVAHELKTPLAIVQTNQGILQRTTDDARRAVALNDIGAGVVRCNHLVHQLLGLARLEEQLGHGSRRRDVDVAEFVRLRVAHAEALANARQITLDLSAPDSLPATLDVDAFAQAIDNLLDNAIKYSPLGGSVQLVLEATTSSEVVKGLRFSVIDHGPGIAPESRTRAFERFERLDARSQDKVVDGAGLGLTIVRRAVKRLGGEIQLLASDPDGSGLTAWVDLPI